MTPDLVCLVFAVVCFVLAAFPSVTNGKVRYECLGFAFVTLTLLI